MENKDLMAFRDLKVHKEQMELQDHKEKVELKDNVDLKDHQEQRVQTDLQELQE